MYSDAVFSERHGRLQSNSGEEHACQLYAHEMLLDSPVSPFPRIEAQMDAATQPFWPLGRSPDHTDFAREAYRYIGTLMQESHQVFIHVSVTLASSSAPHSAVTPARLPPCREWTELYAIVQAMRGRPTIVAFVTSARRPGVVTAMQPSTHRVAHCRNCSHAR